MEYLEITAHVKSSLPWQRQGLQQTSSGYGTRLTTEHMVKVRGLRDVWRRVYAVCYSNAASFYILIDGKSHFIRDSDLEGN